MRTFVLGLITGSIAGLVAGAFCFARGGTEGAERAARAAIRIEAPGTDAGGTSSLGVKNETSWEPRRLDPSASRSPESESAEVAGRVEQIEESPPARMGWLEIDPGRRMLDVTVSAPDEFGGWERDLSNDREGEPLRVRLWPGPYTVEWHRVDPNARFRRRVEIRAGETTTVLTVREEEAPDDPVPVRLARLRVAAFDLGGRPVPGAIIELYVGVGDELQPHSLDLDGRGAGSIDLPPTHARLAIGGQRRDVELVAGRETQIEFHPAGEGEFRVVGYGDAIGHAELTGEDGIRRPWIGAGVRGDRLVYVPPGEYSAWWSIGQGTSPRFPLGRCVVEAGRTTVVEARLPSGSLEVEVRAEPAPRIDAGESAKPQDLNSLVRIEIEPREEASPPGRTAQLVSWERASIEPVTIRFPVLTPGEWRLRAFRAETLLSEESITIGATTVRRTVTLRPQ